MLTEANWELKSSRELEIAGVEGIFGNERTLVGGEGGGGLVLPRRTTKTLSRLILAKLSLI